MIPNPPETPWAGISPRYLSASARGEFGDVSVVVFMHWPTAQGREQPQPALRAKLMPRRAKHFFSQQMVRSSALELHTCVVNEC
eukprot:5970130-Amphidinium_carterae.1